MGARRATFAAAAFELGADASAVGGLAELLRVCVDAEAVDDEGGQEAHAAELSGGLPGGEELADIAGGADAMLGIELGGAGGDGVECELAAELQAGLSVGPAMLEDDILPLLEEGGLLCLLLLATGKCYEAEVSVSLCQCGSPDAAGPQKQPERIHYLQY
jgi:hypothetical protein